MSNMILFFLLICALIAMILKRIRISVALISISVVWMLLVGSGFLSQILLDGLQTQGSISEADWKSRNAIVVLGFGTTQGSNKKRVTTHTMGSSRVFETARLYYSCKKQGQNCTIIASGGDPKKSGHTEAEIMSRELTEVGIPESDIILESKSNNTFQNAKFSSEILQSKAFDQVFLVTSGIHLNRALTFFSHFKIQAIPAPSDQMVALKSWLPLSANFMLFDFAWHEHFGKFQYKLYQALGWN